MAYKREGPDLRQQTRAGGSIPGGETYKQEPHFIADSGRCVTASMAFPLASQFSGVTPVCEELGGASPAGRGLGTYGGFVGRLPKTPEIDPETGEISEAPAKPKTLEEKRRRKYRRGRAMAQLLQHKDLAGCHAWQQARCSPVGVHVKQGVERGGFFSNLQTCGLVHLCAHCQPKVAARRADEAQAAIDAWTAQGGAVLLVTLTLSHGPTDPLSATLGALKQAGQRVAQHRAWKAETARAGLIGRIVATEYTHGANGWHPHQHQLWFVRAGVDRGALEQALSSAWAASVAKAGGSASRAHGLRIDGGDKAARYVAGMKEGKAWTLADELTRSASKTGRNGGRSVWELLDVWDDRAQPEDDRLRAALLLREYARETKGTKALKWSPGLKARFAVQDVDDKELAERIEDPDTLPMAFVAPDDWPHVVRHRAQPDVLSAAEDGGAQAVRLLVAGLRGAG